MTAAAQRSRPHGTAAFERFEPIRRPRRLLAKARVSLWPRTITKRTASWPQSVPFSRGRLGTTTERGPMPKAVSCGKQRSVSGKLPPHEQPAQNDVDRIAAALRQLYGRIVAEPVPRRFVELLNRLKLRQ